MAAATENKDLVDGLKGAKSKRAYFALVLKGSSDGALLVSKTKVSPADIATAKKESGGSAVLKGFCHYEEGRYIFETAKPAPATAAQAVKTIAKRDAGMAMQAEFRISTDPELLAEEGDQAAPAAPAPPPTAAAPAKAPPAAPVKTPPVAPPKPVAAAPQKAAPAVPAKPAAAPSPGNDVIARLNGMTGAIKAGLAGPNKAQVQALFVAAGGQIKSKDFVQAGQSLDQLEQLLKPASAAAPSGVDDPLAAEWERRVTELDPQVRDAEKKRPGEAKWMLMFMSAQDLGGDGKFKQAIDMLNKIDALLKAPPQQAGPELAAAIQTWTAARNNAVQQLQTEIAVVVATQIDPAAADAAELTKMKHQAELELRAVAKQLAGPLETKQQAVEMEKWLAEDEVVTDVCEIGFDLKGPLLAVLGKIKQHLRG